MTRNRCLLIGLILLLTLTSYRLAADDTSAERWSIDDLVLSEEASDWTLDSAGQKAVWVKSHVVRVEGEEKRVSNLWMSRLDAALEENRTSRPLTHGANRDTSPRFSPDSRHIAFLSNRDLPAGAKADKARQAVPRIWILPMAGGEAYALRGLDRPVTDYAWLDAGNLVALAQESPTASEMRRKEKKDTSVTIDDASQKPFLRLFRLALDGTVTRLTDNDDWIDDLAVSPDGRHAVVRRQQSLSFEFDSKRPPHTYLIDLKSGESRRLFEEGVVQPTRVEWKLDSSGFYVFNHLSRHPVYRVAGILELYSYDLERNRAEKVDLGWEKGLDRGDFKALPDGFLTFLANGVHPKAVRYTRSGSSWKRQDLEGEHVPNLEEFAPASDGSRLVYSTSSVIRPVQWFTAELKGDQIIGETQLTQLNPRFEKKPKGRYEVVHWQGARGDTVEGILLYPLDWREGERRPLVLDIHGGPWSLDQDRWSERYVSPNILWRQRGAFVFQVNYHGSAGYGLDWAESIREHYYELEIPDIESGVDYLIERGLVDPERLGSTGWSNGGILTAELITRTDRYKAATVGAADVEWISDWANVDFGATFDDYYFGAHPWENPQLYIEKSPFFRLEKVSTPTIIHTGTEDRNVPPHQSWSLFRAMQYLEKTPVRFLTYPGELHGLRKVAHQRRKAEEDLAWFDRYLFGTWQAPSLAVKEGSRLEMLLKRSQAKRKGRAFGNQVAGVLRPETVRFGDLEVGRFEITRAQYAEFEKSYELSPGEENLPVVGIGFEAAKSYVAWLSRTAGRPFRLPSEAEAKELSKKAGKGGNTLDHWAGYTANPDDAERLSAALATLGATPLLLPVGRFPGQGEDPVFDLDGNAAEWAIGADGSGVAMGFSAERSTDPRSSGTTSAAYTGFRIVVEAE